MPAGLAAASGQPADLAARSRRKEPGRSVAKSPSQKPAAKAARPHPIARMGTTPASSAKSSNGKAAVNGKPVAKQPVRALAKSAAKRAAKPQGKMAKSLPKTLAAPAVKSASQAAASPVRPLAAASSRTSNARRNEQRTNQALSESRDVSLAARKTKTVSARAAAARAADEQNQNLINNRPSAIPTDTKPRKNTAGLSAHELEFYRDLLLAKRRELVGDMSSLEREALHTTGGSNLSNLPIHMADQGTDNYEQEFTLGLMEKDRRLLRDINAALGKIQDGSYGICEGTGLPISKPRLEAQPWARFSIEHARKLERHMVR